MRRRRQRCWVGWAALALAMTSSAVVPRSATAMALVGSLSLDNQVVYDVAVSGTQVYLAGAMGLAVIDASDPTGPRVIGGLAIPSPGIGIHAAETGALVYIAAGTAGLRVIDVSDPTSPAELGTLQGFANAKAVGVARGRAYVVDGVRGLVVVDVADPALPVTLHEVALVGCTNLAMSGDFLYLTCSEFHVLDATSSSATPILGSVAIGPALDVAVVGPVAYVAHLRSARHSAAQAPRGVTPARRACGSARCRFCGR